VASDAAFLFVKVLRSSALNCMSSRSSTWLLTDSASSILYYSSCAFVYGIMLGSAASALSRSAESTTWWNRSLFSLIFMLEVCSLTSGLFGSLAYSISSLCAHIIVFAISVLLIFSLFCLLGPSGLRGTVSSMWVGDALESARSIIGVFGSLFTYTCFEISSIALP